MDEKRSYAAPAIVIGLLLLLTGYVGSYFSLASRRQIEFFVGVDYPVKDLAFRRFFAPMHWLDCKLRPSYWLPRDYPNRDYSDEEEFTFRGKTMPAEIDGPVDSVPAP